MNTFALDRARPDSPTVRTIFDRLKRGRVVAMFPEGKIKTLENCVLHGGPFKPGIGRIAQLADVPVIPCAIIGTSAYSRFTSWLPLRRVRYGVNFGEPLVVRKDLGKDEALADFLDRLKQAYLDLYAELQTSMPAAEK